MKLAERTKPTKFIKLGNDHYGTGSGVTLIREKCFSEIAYNASDSGAYKNRYFGCTLDMFCDGIWPQMLDPEIKDCLVPVPIVVAEGNSVATLHTIYRIGFALSCTEVGLSGWQTEGTAFAYFNSNQRRIGYLEDTTTAVYWGLRSPYSGAYYACCVNTGGCTTTTCATPTSRLAPLLILNLLSLYLTARTAMDATRSRACRARPGDCM